MFNRIPAVVAVNPNPQISVLLLIKLRFNTTSTQRLFLMIMGFHYNFTVYIIWSINNYYKSNSEISGTVKERFNKFNKNNDKQIFKLLHT